MKLNIVLSLQSDKAVTYPLGHQILHALGNTVGKLGQILGRQSLTHLSAILGEVEEGRLLHSVFSKVGQQFSIHNILHHQQIWL